MSNSNFVQIEDSKGEKMVINLEKLLYFAPLESFELYLDSSTYNEIKRINELTILRFTEDKLMSIDITVSDLYEQIINQEKGE